MNLYRCALAHPVLSKSVAKVIVHCLSLTPFVYISYQTISGLVGFVVSNIFCQAFILSSQIRASLADPGLLHLFSPVVRF